MATYDEFRRLFEDESPEQKLAMLRPESLRILSMLHASAWLVQSYVQERGTPQMPPDFGEWCKQIVAGTQEMMDLLAAFMDTKHRDLIQQEAQQQRTALGEIQWLDEQAEYTELQNYSSFIEAVKEIAAKLGFALPADIQIVNPFYPAIMSAFSSPSRRVNIEVVLTKRKLRPTGFAVTLSELAADGINVKGQGRGHAGITTSLDEVVLVLCRWLIDNWELERLRNEYEWMKLGAILWQ